jgi:type I restriction enzyme S subunit
MTQVRQREAQQILESMVVARYQMYPAYRDSGVEWLGEIPSHWEVRRLKTIVSLRPSNIDKKTNEDDVPVRLCNYTDVYYNDFITGDMELMEATATPDQIQKFELKAGDVIITKDSESADDIAVAAFVPHDLEKVVCGYHLALLRPLTGAVEGRYLFRAFSAYPITSQFEIAANGITRYGLSQSAIGDAWFLLPPLSEQRAITAFLDRQTAKIDALIAKKRELIAALHEQRSAIISHAVTKGLNPDAPLKDSGIEWLGEIPAGWEVVRLKFLAQVPFQYGANEAATDDDPDMPRYIRITDIRDNGTLNEETFRSLPEAVARPYLLQDGDLLFARSGATVGKTFRYYTSWGKACYAGYLIRFRPKTDILLPEFMDYFTRSLNYWEWISSTFIQSTIQNISAERYANLVIALPSIVEQYAIATYLNEETARIDTLAAKVEATIERLQEYRAALISAAVTGKIDVWGEVSIS